MSLLIKALKQAETRHKLATADALAHNANELAVAPAPAAEQSAVVSGSSEPSMQAAAMPTAAKPTLDATVLSIEPVIPVSSAPPASIDRMGAQQNMSHVHTASAAAVSAAMPAAPSTATPGSAKVVSTAASLTGRGKSHRWFLSGVAGTAVLFTIAWLAWAAYGRPAPMPVSAPPSALLPTAVAPAANAVATVDDKPVSSTQQPSASPSDRVSDTLNDKVSDESARTRSSTAPAAVTVTPERGARPNKMAMLSRSPQPVDGKSNNKAITLNGPEHPATTAALQPAPAAAPMASGRRANDASAIQFTQSEIQHDKAIVQLDAGYQALLNNDLGGAKRSYEQALALDRNSGDALIGLATIAARGDQSMQAERLYRRALEIDPNDTDARAGLIALRRAADPSTQESALRGLVAQENATASNHLALGNLLAAQGRWPEAQQSYFMAVSADPNHPDYAFNLAISLDRMRQAPAAIAAYRRAIELAQQRPARFTLAQAQARLAALLPVQTGSSVTASSQQPSKPAARQEMPASQGQLASDPPTWHSEPINLQSVSSDHGR